VLCEVSTFPLQEIKFRQLNKKYIFSFMIGKLKMADVKMMVKQKLLSHNKNLL